MTTMPVYFISHGGGPWPYVENMRQMLATTEKALKAFPARLATKPTAVLIISGHWEAEAFTVSTAEHPPMLYDYGGFPDHTYHIRYPAPGSPAVAAKVKQLLLDTDVIVREDSKRGFDHGTFVPLVLMYPDADVPVVMLSMKSTFDPEEHIRVGQALSSLRNEGVLIVGSGNTYHNMSGFGPHESTRVAESFKAYLGSAIAQPDWRVRNKMLIDWQTTADARLAQPREDHLIPLMVVAGAAAEDCGRETFVDHLFNMPEASYAFGEPRL